MVRIDTEQDIQDLRFIRTGGRSVTAADDNEEGQPEYGRRPTTFLSPLGPVAVTLELSSEASIQMWTRYTPDYAPGGHLSNLVVSSGRCPVLRSWCCDRFYVLTIGATAVQHSWDPMLNMRIGAACQCSAAPVQQ